MLRAMTLVLGCAVVLGLSVPATAQDSSTTNANDNLTPGVFHGGTPGSWVQAAISRHNGLIGARVNSVRSGGEAGDRTALNAAGGSSESAGGLGSLLNLVNSVGSFGSLGDLAGLATGGSSGTSTSGGNTVPPPSNGSNYTLADLIAMRDANEANKASGNQINTGAGTTKTGTYQSMNNQRNFGGGISRLPKPEQRFQQSDTMETKFVVRWANAMLQTMFSAVAVGFQSNSFIELVKDSLRPLFIPPADTSGNTDDGGSDGSDTDDGGGDSGGTDGSGIEDLNPDDSGDDGGDSTI